MKRSQSVDAFLSGKLAPVDVRKIEQELNRLWTKASDSGSGKEYPQVVRACFANLILYTESPDAETTETNMLDEVIVTHPSRGILAICRQAAERKLAAWVTARCRLASTPETKQICSELITILAEGEFDHELISLVESLLIGDLPVFLWWSTGDLSGDKIGPFLSCARRLIVDSAHAPCCRTFLRNLHQIVESTSGCIAVSDLTWRRLVGIRAAIAEEFERPPFTLADLSKIEKVRISTCTEQTKESISLQSLLLLGWLASRLGWEAIAFELENPEGPLARFDQEGRTIEVQFNSCPEKSQKSPGAIFEVELEAVDQKRLLVSRNSPAEAGSLLVTVSEGNNVVRQVIADDNNLERTRLVGCELDDMSGDPIFDQSLESAFEIARLLEE